MTVDVLGDGTGNNGDFELLDNMQTPGDQDTDAAGNAFSTSGQTNTNVYAEGTASNTYQAKSVTNQFGFAGVYNSGNNWDVSDKHVYIWVRSLDPFQTEGYNTDEGMIMRISNASNGGSPYDQHEVGGQDTRRATYEGFIRLAFDVNRTPDESAGTLGLTSVDGIYVGGTMVSGSGQNTYFVDAAHAGNFFRVYAGTSGTPLDSAHIAADAEIENTGTFTAIGAIYYILAGMKFGDVAGTGATYFEDLGQVWFFQDQNVANDLYTITLDANATGTHSFILGTKVGTGVTATGVGGNTLVATQEPFNLVATDSDFDTIGLYGCSFLNAPTTGGTFNLGHTNIEVLSCLFDSCDEITIASGVDFRFNTITNSQSANTDGAVDMGSVNPGTNDAVRDLNFTNCNRAMKFTGTGNRTIDLKNITFSGNTYALRIDHGAGDTITVNTTEGGTSLVAGDIENVNGSTINIVNDPATTKFTTVDAAGDPIQNVRVFTETSDSGGASGLPYEESVTSLTQTGGTATLTATSPHGLATNDYVVVRGANHEEYNRVAQITVTSTTVFTYSVPSGATSPAGGTPVFSYVPVYGLTDVNGEISSSKAWPASQGVSGWARKSTSEPYYKQTTITIADASSGTDATLSMQLDS